MLFNSFLRRCVCCGQFHDDGAPELCLDCLEKLERGIVIDDNRQIKNTFEEVCAVPCGFANSDELAFSERKC